MPCWDAVATMDTRAGMLTRTQAHRAPKQRQCPLPHRALVTARDAVAARLTMPLRPTHRPISRFPRTIRARRIIPIARVHVMIRTIAKETRAPTSPTATSAFRSPCTRWLWTRRRRTARCSVFFCSLRSIAPLQKHLGRALALRSHFAPFSKPGRFDRPFALAFLSAA